MTRKDIESRITEVESVVKKACYSSENVFGTGIWDHHIKWVVKFGRMLSMETGADALVIELAALLHDYASVKSFAQYTNHHVHGVREAEYILGPLGFDSTTIEAVGHCILTHRGSMCMERKTIEAICVADADAMAHFVGVPSLLQYATNGKGLNLSDACGWVLAKLKRSWNKLSPTGKRLARPYFSSAVDLLSNEDQVMDLLMKYMEGRILKSKNSIENQIAI